METPPKMTTLGSSRMPLAGLPGWVSFAVVVSLLKLAAVHAFPMAVFGVCGPA
jgi:hypothetical protein